jgi:hypothetical protein
MGAERSVDALLLLLLLLLLLNMRHLSRRKVCRQACSCMQQAAG